MEFNLHKLFCDDRFQIACQSLTFLVFSRGNIAWQEVITNWWLHQQFWHIPFQSDFYCSHLFLKYNPIKFIGFHCVRNFLIQLASRSIQNKHINISPQIDYHYLVQSYYLSIPTYIFNTVFFFTKFVWLVNLAKIKL